jgi:hypothetical protein
VLIDHEAEPVELSVIEIGLDSKSSEKSTVCDEAVKAAAKQTMNIKTLIRRVLKNGIQQAPFILII